MKRQLLLPIAMLALATSQAAQAQEDSFCTRVKALSRAALEPKPFSSFVSPTGAATFLPAEEFRDCTFTNDGSASYSCFLSVPGEEYMETLHGGMSQMLQECFGIAPMAEQVEPALLATGKLPYLSFEVATNQVTVNLYPRQDWGAYAEDAWDEEFTDFGFSLVVSRY